MSAFRFQRTAVESIEAPWRALDRALSRWVLAHGGDDLLATVAAWASYAESLGDTALRLGAGDGRSDLPSWDETAIASLRAAPLVSDGSAQTPFVVDADGRFFLWRNYAHEAAIARRVRDRVGTAVRLDHAVSTLDLDLLFDGDDGDPLIAQRRAVASVPGQRLFVLTGGPGTGKTSTVLKMLLMLQRDRVERPVIALAAPTGKAAQRLLQAVRAGKDALALRLPVDWQPALQAIPDQEALTLHRLLGFSPQRNLYARHRDDPIAADVVVVDEASMVDLAMLQALLDALRPEACLILVGDADQLTSVAAGSVLQDLVQFLEQAHPQQVVRLQHSFRAAQDLVRVNAAVRSGERAALHGAVAQSQRAAQVIEYLDRSGLLHLSARWATLLSQRLLRTIDAALTDGSSASPTVQALQALRVLGEQQVLCALREEGSGALAVNRLIEQKLRGLWQVPVDDEWYAGRAVMIVRNDYAAGLFNGDVGLTLVDPEGALSVWFESRDDAGNVHARAFAPATLPEHEGAFAITIHKSQGSEYAQVAVVLPPLPGHRILSRQLLYTALSRARASVEIWSGPDVVEAALEQVALRHGGLAARLG